ncbi:MAG: DUF1549 domain-containing protein, partial [Planctomycetota bacterium]
MKCAIKAFVVAWALWSVPAIVTATTPLDFEREIAPVLSENCLGCHSDNIAKGGFSLSTIEHLRDNDFAIPGDAESSYLLELITPDGEQPPAMPHEREPLSPAQVDSIRRWVDAGMIWPDDLILLESSEADETWWSLQDVVAESPPALDDAKLEGTERLWKESPIDRFVMAELLSRGLRPNPPADRRSLIRRLAFDLTGLPPTADEVERFQLDQRPDAVERLVDEMLARPEYGQRWGRHWLDVVRFGESTGFEQNYLINSLWPFRDYVIESINRDVPFDRFIREHVAGDRVKPADQSALRSWIGSALLVAGAYDTVKNQDAVQAAQIRANTIDEMIRATSESFLGLTIGCARCHDHKFDPIRQSDYYSLHAVLS